MKSNSRDGKASLDSVECSEPPTMLSAASSSLQQKVSLDCVGLGVDLLPVQVDGHFLAVLSGELPQGLLGHGQHAAGAASAVYSRYVPVLDLVGDRQEDQPDRFARGPVLAPLPRCSPR